VRDHQSIDRRSLALAQAIVAKIDANPMPGVHLALSNITRWCADHDVPCYLEWREILQRPWPEVRATLLDDTEEGRRLRQSNPFAGVLTPHERWAIYRSFDEAS